jgi:hypothetical protein
LAGSSGTTDLPTDIIFYTTLDGGNTQKDNVRVSHNGDLVVGSGERLTPTAGRLRGPVQSGVDATGVDLAIQSGLGTGAAASGNITFWTNATGGASSNNVATALQRATILANGNMGIGYPAPSEVLSVNGNERLDGALKGTVRYYVSSNTASGNKTSTFDYLTLTGVTPGAASPGDYIVTFSWCGTDHETGLGTTDVMSIDYSGDAGAGNTFLTNQGYPKNHLTNDNMICNTYSTIVTIPASQIWTFKIKIMGGTKKGELFNGTITALRVN